MKKAAKKLKEKIKPRFSWWKGNHWDLGDGLFLLVVIVCFFPILPWQPRNGSNYLIGGKAAAMEEVLDQFPSDILEELGKIYERKYPDKGLRKCRQSRDIVLSMIVQDREMTQAMNSRSESNVPAIFFLENLLMMPILSAIALPSFNNVVRDVAENCAPYPGEFLDVESAKRFYKVGQ